MADVATILDQGIPILRAALQGTGPMPNRLGVGTGTGTHSDTDTDLGTPSADAHVAGTLSSATTTLANDSVEIAGTLVSASDQTIGEYGLYTAGGVCVVAVQRATPAGLVADQGIDLAITVALS